MTDALAARLRAATSVLHRQAERTPFMAALLRGRMTAPAYCLLLRNLEAIYESMEIGLCLHDGHPAVSHLVVPAVFRTDALRDDLQELHGSGWREDLDRLPACARYTARLREIADRDPALLVAHAYVRYLGDLSGGQMLKDIVSRSLGLAPLARGTAFYEFGPPERVAMLAQRLRAGIDLAGQAAGASAAMVQEARHSFEMHCDLFGELADACGIGAESL
ncbi:MAG: biliverdin-producing heme oxygenase [Comamonadaceae bacterium]|nr:MAG: biliverdin-producing heme oxygenase [Comamonadaceae bacterium]